MTWILLNEDNTQIHEVVEELLEDSELKSSKILPLNSAYLSSFWSSKNSPYIA